MSAAAAASSSKAAYAFLLVSVLLPCSCAFQIRHVQQVIPRQSAASLTARHIGATSDYLSSAGRTPSSSTSTSWSNANGASPASSSSGSSFSDTADDSSFFVAILGDLHMDPRKMEDYEIGRQHWRKIFEESNTPNVAVVSLGDLGESKSVRPLETPELFAGTTECHMMAAEYLRSFGDGIDYEVVGGNHDLEGIDEFPTDQENLELFLRAHNKPTPQFIRYIADKTALVGLTSTVFRDAKYTSHEGEYSILVYVCMFHSEFHRLKKNLPPIFTYLS
jgi:hypothetical protein